MPMMIRLANLAANERYLTTKSKWRGVGAFQLPAFLAIFVRQLVLLVHLLHELVMGRW